MALSPEDGSQPDASPDARDWEPMTVDYVGHLGDVLNVTQKLKSKPDPDTLANDKK